MTDWPKIIKELRYCGLTAKGIERISGVKYRTIYELSCNQMAQPRHDEGEKILSLHADMEKIIQNQGKSLQQLACS